MLFFLYSSVPILHLPENVKELYMSKDVIVFTRQTLVQKHYKIYFLADNNNIMAERHYAEALKEELETEIQSEAYDFNHTISIESSTFEYHNKSCNYVSNEKKERMDFHSNFSDESSHNAATTFLDIKIFIHWMYDNIFFINDG